MGQFEERFEQMRKFYNAGQTELALDRVNSLLHSGLLPQQRWQVYEACGLCWQQLGNIGKAVGWFWQAINSTEGLPPGVQRKIFSNYLFLLHYLPDIRDTDFVRQHFLYGQLFQAIRQYSHQARVREKLRIGYLSPDFNDHVDVFFLIQLLACYDTSRYEVYCYALKPEEDQTTGQLKGLVDGWKNLSGLAPEAAARSIYEDQVDILFDVSGHTYGGLTLRIAAYKPAPVQVLGIGYMSTSGLGAMDYFLTDVYCDPPGQGDECFREKLIRLPHSHFCYTPSERALAVRQTRRPQAAVVFGSFNRYGKITEAMLALWQRILAAVPGARLVLENSHSHHEEHLLRQWMQRVGMDAARVELRQGSIHYLEDYLDIDIALDTYPYTGGGTTCDALYMGVPVISLYGQRHGTRFGYSLLMNIGVGELAAATPEDYAAKAVALARDPALREGLHQRLRGMMQASPVMDGRGYTREVEAAYERMWQAWLAAAPAAED